MPEFIPWVLGSHCVTYIYIMCIYILYIFWLGLFLIQLYETVASPIPKRCPISVLENEKEGGDMSSCAPGEVSFPLQALWLSWLPLQAEVGRCTGKTSSPWKPGFMKQ